ncbi:MAG: hypothetical protein LBD11_06705 [Candidatus Peribacteria bacterium]|jgi:hypothetical protein|nr:hypothetical protein [Candidatus Peribacteria bacterium]
MHYTDAECKKLGGEAVQADTYASATQLYPKDPIRKSYLCGEKGILLGTINQ